MDIQSNHKLYIANTNKMNFNQHNDKAKSLGLELVSIHDEQSYDYVHKFGKQAFNDQNKHYFVGGQRTSKTNGKDDCCWKWSDGSKWDYHKWHGREPNNWRSSEDVVNMYTHVNGMNDISSRHVTHAIYHQKIPSNDTIKIPNNDESSNPLKYKSEMFDKILGSDHYELEFNVRINKSNPENHWRNIFTYGDIKNRSPALWINRKNSWWWHLSFVKDVNETLLWNWSNWRDKSSNIEIYVPEKFRNFGTLLKVKISMKKTSDNAFEVICTINGEPAILPPGKKQMTDSMEIPNDNYHKKDQIFETKMYCHPELRDSYEVKDFILKKHNSVQGFTTKEGMENKARLYIANRDPKTWDEHNASAKALGGHMVSIPNKETNDYILNFSKRLFNKGFYIGGYRFAPQPTSEQLKNTYHCQSYIDRYPDLQNYYTSCEFKIDGDCQQHPQMSNKDWFNDSEYGGPQGYPSTYITKEMCNARKQHWIKSCSSKGGSKDSEQNITYDTKVIDDILAQDVWEISMDISISESSKKWRNIFHYGNKNHIRAPAMWLWPNYRNNEEDIWRFHLIVRLVAPSDWDAGKWHPDYNYRVDFYVPEEFRNLGESFNLRIKYKEKESTSTVVVYINDVEAHSQDIDGIFERKTNQEFGIKKTWDRYTDVDNYTVNNFDMKKVATNIDINASHSSNIKSVTLPSSNMTVGTKPLNKQSPYWGDKFKTTTSGNQVDVQRTDATVGWGQNLTLRGTFSSNPLPPKISMRYKDGKDCSVESTATGVKSHWNTNGKNEGRNPSKPQYDFLFNGCPRGPDVRWLKKAGTAETYVSCAAKCDEDQDCNIFEINGCGGENHHPRCKGSCQLFKGTNAENGQECNQNGSTKTYLKINYGNSKYYKWTDGSAWNFMNWYQGQPDNWEKIEDKASMISNGKWNDVTSTARLPSIYYKEIWNPHEILLPNDPSESKDLIYRSPQFDDILGSDNFEIEFKMTITNNQRGWRNIFHYGDKNVTRSPSMFIYPNNSWVFLYGIQKKGKWLGWRKSQNYYQITVPEESRKFGQEMLIKIQWTSSKTDENPLMILVNGKKALIEIFNDKGSWGNKSLPEESEQEKEFYQAKEQLFKLKFAHNKKGYDINNVYIRKLNSDTIRSKPNTSKQGFRTITDNFSVNPIGNMSNYSFIEGMTGLATKQNEVANIMDSEVRRVQSKKAELDGVMFSQKRELELNESHRQRHRYYIYMMLILVVALVAFVIIGRMREMVQFIPGFVYDILVVLAIVIPGFLIYFAYLDIRRRDHMDFSKVQLAQPRRETADERAEREADYVAAGDLSALGKLCSGEDCCAATASWNSTTGKCD